jgi:hypothetical protein
MTKAVINELSYNTDTATEIGLIGGGGTAWAIQPEGWSARLYVTEQGDFFMDGGGNPRSLYAGGHGIKALEEHEAFAFAEQRLDAEVVYEHFADWVDPIGERRMTDEDEEF